MCQWVGRSYLVQFSRFDKILAIKRRRPLWQTDRQTYRPVPIMILIPVFIRSRYFRFVSIVQIACLSWCLKSNLLFICYVSYFLVFWWYACTLCMRCIYKHITKSCASVPRMKSAVLCKYFCVTRVAACVSAATCNLLRNRWHNRILFRTGNGCDCFVLRIHMPIRFSAVVTSFVARTKLLNVEPG